MNYIVLDLEWNQALTYQDMIKEPVFLTGEIIQIGAVKLDDSFNTVDTFNRRVTPEYYKTMHPKVAKLTKLTDHDICKGDNFPTVFWDFCEWCGNEISFLIWGTEDIQILRKNMLLHDINVSYMPAYYNLQNIFAAQISHDHRQYSLVRALNVLHESPFDAHDALNDAKSTALICRHLNLTAGLLDYTHCADLQTGCVESYEFDEPYLNIGDALDDDYVVSFECPSCGCIVWGEHWVHKTPTQLLSEGTCEDGQKYLIQLRFKVFADQRVQVKRLVRQLTDDLHTEYMELVVQEVAWKKYVLPA